MMPKSDLRLDEPECPPERRIADVPRQEWVRMIRWHERHAELAMGSLSCGSENGDYRTASRIADAHWCAAALMRLHLRTTADAQDARFAEATREPEE